MEREKEKRKKQLKRLSTLENLLKYPRQEVLHRKAVRWCTKVPTESTGKGEEKGNGGLCNHRVL